MRCGRVKIGYYSRNYFVLVEKHVKIANQIKMSSQPLYWIHICILIRPLMHCSKLNWKERKKKFFFCMNIEIKMNMINEHGNTNDVVHYTLNLYNKTNLGEHFSKWFRNKKKTKKIAKKSRESGKEKNAWEYLSLGSKEFVMIYIVDCWRKQMQKNHTRQQKATTKWGKKKNIVETHTKRERRTMERRMKQDLS